MNDHAADCPRKTRSIGPFRFEVFAERGFRDATVDEIAAKAGVTKGSFYSHYRSKREVILAACNYYYQTYQRSSMPKWPWSPALDAVPRRAETLCLHLHR